MSAATGAPSVVDFTSRASWIFFGSTEGVNKVAEFALSVLDTMQAYYHVLSPALTQLGKTLKPVAIWTTYVYLVKRFQNWTTKDNGEYLHERAYSLYKTTIIFLTCFNLLSVPRLLHKLELINLGKYFKPLCKVGELFLLAASISDLVENVKLLTGTHSKTRENATDLRLLIELKSSCESHKNDWATYKNGLDSHKFALVQYYNSHDLAIANIQQDINALQQNWQLVRKTALAYLAFDIATIAILVLATALPFWLPAIAPLALGSVSVIGNMTDMYSYFVSSYYKEKKLELKR